MAEIDIPIDTRRMASLVGFARLARYGVIKLGRISIPSSLNRWPGELLVFTVDEETWAQIRQGRVRRSPEQVFGLYPGRVVGLYAEVILALKAMGIDNPVESQVIAQAMLAGDEATNERKDLLEFTAAEEAAGRPFIESSVNTRDRRFTWFNLGDHSRWWALACVPDTGLPLCYEDLFAAFMVTVSGWSIPSHQIDHDIEAFRQDLAREPDAPVLQIR